MNFPEDELILACKAELAPLFPDATILRLGSLTPPAEFDGANVWPYVDLTVLKPAALPADIEALCATARAKGVAAVCVHGKYVELAAQALRGSGIGVAAVVNFPMMGQTAKLATLEADAAAMDGATELDPVHPIHLLKTGKWREYVAFLRKITNTAVDERCKVILETQLLSEREIVLATLLCRIAGAAGVKTSTGVNTYVDESGHKQTVHATVAHIRLMRRAFGDTDANGQPAIIKASGGVKTASQAVAMLNAGANRIGTSNIS